MTPRTNPATYCDCCPARSRCLGRLYNETVGPTGPHCFPAGIVRGKHLFRSGDAAGTIHLLRAGTMKVYVAMPDGHEQVVGFHFPGDVVSIDAAGGDRHHRSAVAITPCQVCRLPLENLQEACTRNRLLYGRLLDAMGQEIQRMQSMLKLERLSAEQRVALFLLHQSRRHLDRDQIPPGTEVDLPMSRGELAAFLDLAAETVSRCLAQLQQRGIVRLRNRHRLQLLDPGALDALLESTPGPVHLYSVA
jgi:CRP/FNR family transcriptional regulator